MSRILYKYTSAKYIDSILKDGGRLKLSSPKSFNDPSDCYFGVSEENLNRSFRMLVNVAFICEFANDSELSKNKQFMTAYKLTRKSVFLSHVYDENPGVNLLINKYLKQKPDLKVFFDGYKDKFDKIYSDIIETLRERTLIGCLSPENDNGVMWSHYADNHEGICVEYEFEDSNNLLNVVYTDEMNDFDLYTVLRYIIPAKYFKDKNSKEMNQECLNACYLPFLRKGRDWSSEKEVRMVFNLNNNSNIINENGIWFYPSVKVKSIYIGCKTDCKTANYIENICKKENIFVHYMKIEKGTSKPATVD